MVQPYCDGVDLNCGCPQTWAIHEGIGCGLMSRREVVRDMVLAAKRRCGDGFCVSVKMRIHRDLRFDFISPFAVKGISDVRGGGEV